MHNQFNAVLLQVFFDFDFEPNFINVMFGKPFVGMIELLNFVILFLQMCRLTMSNV